MSPHTLTVPGGSLAYDRHGEAGAPVICVPGLGDTRASWRALAPALAAAGHTVFVMDLRGHGGSSTGFPVYSAAAIAGDVAALIDAEELRGVTIIGNSIGGGAACRVAVERPERVARLVLVNPFVRDMPAERWLRPLVPLVFARPWGGWAWGKYRETLFITQPADQAENRAEVLANLAEPGRLEATRAMLRASKADIAARLSALAVPSLVLMGAQDPDYPDPAAEGENLRGLLGGAVTVEMIERAGHYPQIERPEETAALVLGFLGEARLGA
jgi:pimeloyl-ACP methyl ester carboxylesterase